MINNANGIFSVVLFQDITDENHNILGILCKWTINQKVVKVIKNIEVESNTCKDDKYSLLYFNTKLCNHNLLQVTDDENLHYENNIQFKVIGIALPWSSEDGGVFTFVLSNSKKKINEPGHIFFPL